MISKDILVSRWIAEGFITKKEGFTLKQVAESYFYEFINRSLVRCVTSIPRYEMHGGEEGCLVHDIVLNFLLSRSAEENFLTMLDGQGLPSSDQRIRRLSLWKNPGYALQISRGDMNLSHLHSFSICSGCLKMPPTFHLPCLRVLDLEGCGSFKNVDLNCILRLFHLRYLGFRGTSGVMLPVQVWNLHYLQTLDVNGTGVTRLPESTIHLKLLMRLVGQGLIMPDGFGNMS